MRRWEGQQSTEAPDRGSGMKRCNAMLRRTERKPGGDMGEGKDQSGQFERKFRKERGNE